MIYVNEVDTVWVSVTCVSLVIGVFEAICQHAKSAVRTLVHMLHWKHGGWSHYLMIENVNCIENVLGLKQFVNDKKW